MVYFVTEAEEDRKKSKKKQKKDWERISEYARTKCSDIYWLKDCGFKRRCCFKLLRDARHEIDSEPSIQLSDKEKKVP